MELVEVEIDSLAFGGRGVARANGFVVFVTGALPGDRVRAEVTKGKKRFAEARTIELLRPGADRIPDSCLHGGEPCPGAPWQGLPYESQLADKQRQVDEALRRIGGLEDFETAAIVRRSDPGATATSSSTPSARRDGETTPRLPRPWPLGPDRRCRGLPARLRSWQRGPQCGPRMGAFGGRSPPTTAAQSRASCATSSSARDGVPARSRPGWSPRRPVFRRPPVDLHTAIEGDPRGQPTARPESLGDEHLAEQLCGLELEMSHGAFFQTNTEMAERLYAVAAEFGGLTGAERVFDLFCGIGTIGLTMAAHAAEIWGLEIVPEAIADAERNAKRNRIENAQLPHRQRPHRPAAADRAGWHARLVFIDPPRAGLSQKIVRRVIECGARRIVYVSCNPTTLAPNASQLDEAGYKLRRVRPVDMFPQTPHIECVALFERD